MDDLDVTTGTLPAGFQFGAYVISGCIGQGGMARIYRAEHRVLRKPVALKVMESVLLERPDGRPRFLREGQAAAAVKHPNVVDITDVGVWQGRPYLVMELLEGEDLEQYLSRHKPLAEHDVARLMIPVIAGLTTAHASGVVHRDLKPSNIFLSRGPVGEIVPKVLDFGISKLANSVRTLDPSSTPVGELMGSPMYMSPEAVRGARDLTAQSDQYSLGVVLYECVTGRPPFYGDSLLSVLEAVAHGKFESPRTYRPDLSAVLENAIMRAMSRDPSDRFANVRDLGRALCEAADHRTRLLWTPSFGLREPLSRNTAPLGTSPIRTGSPLTTSVTKRARHWPAWQVALLGLVAMLVFVFGVVSYWRASELPYAEKGNLPPPPQALEAAAALAPRAEPLPAPQGSEPSDRGVALAAPTSPVSAPFKDGQKKQPRMRREPVAEAKAPVASRAKSNRALASDVPPARPAVTAPEIAQPEVSDGSELEEIEFLVRPSQAPRAAPVLGANQSPILD